MEIYKIHIAVRNDVRDMLDQSTRKVFFESYINHKINISGQIVKRFSLMINNMLRRL